MSGMYLYGIIECDDINDISPLDVRGGKQVLIMPYRELACLMREHDEEDFHDLPRKELLKNLLSHQQLLETMMKKCTVLPVKFGTILEDPGESTNLLSQCYQELIEKISFIRNKVEIEVAATWDTDRTLQKIREEKEIKNALERIKHSDYPLIEKQIMMGQIVKTFMDKYRKKYQEKVMDNLSLLSVDTTSNMLLSDKMVFNTAFLVESTRQNEFDQAVRRLDELFKDEIDFRVICPLPAYSFSTLEIIRIAREQVEHAHKTLNLEEPADSRGIRQAYRYLAAKCQREIETGSKDSIDKLSALRKASRILEVYYNHTQKSGFDSRESMLKLKDDSHLFAISINKSSGEKIDPVSFGGAVRV